MTKHPQYAFSLDRRQLRRNLDRAAEHYDGAALLHQEVCRRLLERLDLVRLAPGNILDAGAGTGQAAEDLSRRYRRARVCALDLSEPMLARARGRQGLLRKFYRVCADLDRLPLKKDSQDLVISSLALHWCPDLNRTLGEFARVLKPGGLLSFASFGPDTLTELRQAWARVDRDDHVNPFIDMHDVGDALLRAGFSDPVLDVEHITVRYPDLDRLVADLRATGETNAAGGRPRGLTTPSRRQALVEAYEEFRDYQGLPATCEIVYAHAWGSEPAQRTGAAGETFIPLESLNRRPRP
jgi:malonyl-CoA O-methyltransferase